MYRKYLSEDGFEIELFDLDDNYITSFATLKEADTFIYTSTYTEKKD